MMEEKKQENIFRRVTSSLYFAEIMTIVLIMGFFIGTGLLVGWLKQ